jgi:hypothetical protein
MLLISRRFLLPWAVLCLMPATALSQIGSIGTMEGPEIDVHRSVIGRVTNEKGESVRGARVEITTNAGTRYRSVETDPQGRFDADYILTFAPKEFIVTVAVFKKGYPTAHAFANYGSSGKPVMINAMLRQPPTDPTLLSEADLISGLTPKLRTVDPSDGLSGKVLKTYEKGVEQYLDRRRVDLAVPMLESVVASNPSCFRCRIMLAMADLSWQDWGGTQHQVGESVNAIVLNRKLSRPEPLVAFGVMQTWERKPYEAEPYLIEAVRDAPKDALALQELGRVQSLTMNWEGAEISLRNALAAGAGPEARLLHAQALVWAGTNKDAEAELNRYLDGRDIKKTPPLVREVWERIQDRKKDDRALVKLQKQATPYADYVHNPPPELQHIDPAGEQVKLDPLLTAVGRNIADVFEKLPNTVSLEKIHQEKLNRKGQSAGSLNQQFRYLCLIPSGPWGPQTDEYRADSTGHVAYPQGLLENFMLTAGFVAAPLIFHPTYQPGSEFRLLGRQKAKGRDAYVVVFAQEPKKSRMCGSFRVGSISRETFYQGVAWIDTATYQILRLRTELLTPLPVVKLQTEITDIEFNEVHFSRIPEGFWLPAQVTVTIEWEGQHLRNRHAYSDFVVFNVESMQKIARPKGAPPESAEETGLKVATP